MNKKIFIYGIMLIILISSIYAYSINTFSDSSSTGNMTFNSTINSTYKYLSIIYWAVITKAEIDLKGYNISTSYPNLTIKTNNEITYQNDTMNGTVTDINLNISSLQNCVNNDLNMDTINNTNSFANVNTEYDEGMCNFGGFEYYVQELSNLNQLSFINIRLKGNSYPLTINLTISTQESNTQGVLTSREFELTYKGWINLTFDRLDLTPSTTYYLILHNKDHVTDKFYWNNNCTNAYSYGRQGYSTDGIIFYYPEDDTDGSMQLYYNDNTLCELNFTSSNDGTLEYSNLEIEYDDFFLDDCSVGDIVVLNISGRDEETDEDVNMSLNIYIYPGSGHETGMNLTYELSGNTYYTFCSKVNNTDLTINAIMEYGDGTIYTDRKYYLNDFIIDTTTINNVYLYHLNNSKASEIVFTVFDTTTGDRVSGAFIKILRYYPGENVYRVVEVAKTDEVGQSLGKMVLADVFYKFIIEAPAGTVKLDTGVLRVLSLTRSFGITFVEDYLDTWHKIFGVSKSLTCTKGTQTCRVTWSDESNVVQDVTLEVWRITGLRDTLLFSQTTASAAGTISYTVVEDVAGNTYEARAFVESNTGASRTGWGRSRFFDSTNPFFTDESHRLASLFPLLLLVVCITFALIDWGVIGIVIGSLIGLILGSIIEIIPLSPFYFISFIIIGVILMYKLSK